MRDHFLCLKRLLSDGTARAQYVADDWPAPKWGRVMFRCLAISSITEWSFMPFKKKTCGRNSSANKITLVVAPYYYYNFFFFVDT